jgi:hypothetical protein
MARRRKSSLILERRLADHDQQIAVVFDAIRQLMQEPESPPRPRIGFETETKESAAKP